MNIQKITLLGIAFLFLASCDLAIEDNGETKFTAISFHGKINEEAVVTIHEQPDEDKDLMRYSVRLDMDELHFDESADESLTHTISLVATDAKDNEWRDEVKLVIYR